MKLVWDSKHCQIKVRGVTIHIAPENIPPFKVIAVVEEQDTSLVLQPTEELYDTGDRTPLWVDANKSALLETQTPGDVIVKSFNPMRFLAIIYDLDQTPPIQPQWIQSTVNKIIFIANAKALSAISLPVLGAQHGHFKLEHFIPVLCHALNQNKVNRLKQIWLVVPAENCQNALNLFRQSAICASETT